MSFGSRRQIVHHKFGVEGKEGIRDIRVKAGNKGSNAGDFLPYLYIQGQVKC